MNIFEITISFYRILSTWSDLGSMQFVSDCILSVDDKNKPVALFERVFCFTAPVLLQALKARDGTYKNSIGFEKHVKEFERVVAITWLDLKRTLLNNLQYELSDHSVKLIDKLLPLLDPYNFDMSFCSLMTKLDYSHVPPEALEDYRSRIYSVLIQIDAILGILPDEAKQQMQSFDTGLEVATMQRQKFDPAVMVSCIGADVLINVNHVINNFPGIGTELTDRVNSMVRAICKFRSALDSDLMQRASNDDHISNFSNLVGGHLYWYTCSYVLTRSNQGSSTKQIVRYLNRVTNTIDTLCDFIRTCEQEFAAGENVATNTVVMKELQKNLRHLMKRDKTGVVVFNFEPAVEMIVLIHNLLVACFFLQRCQDYFKGKEKWGEWFGMKSKNRNSVQKKTDFQEDNNGSRQEGNMRGLFNFSRDLSRLVGALDNQRGLQNGNSPFMLTYDLALQILGEYQLTGVEVDINSRLRRA